MDSEKALKGLVSEINRTLTYYERSFSSVKRTPDTYQERCNSFEEFVENRFNFEASKIPELEEAIVATGGKLFECVSIDEPDEKKRRFKTATIRIRDIKDINPRIMDDESLKVVITKVKEYLGGDQISFNSVRKKIKLTIE